MLGDAVVETASNIGTPVAATDPDGDMLTYWLADNESDKFDIDSTTGQLRTRVGESYDYEAEDLYEFRIRLMDSTGSSATGGTTKIRITDQDEPPLAPDPPRVTANADSETSLDVSWTAPNNQGRPRIRSYDLQYREGNTGDFTDGPQNVTGKDAVIEDLDPDTTYEVRVRATNQEGDGEWSPNGAATTPQGTTRGDGIFENVRIVETTIDYVELDWDMPPTKIAGTRITRHRQGDPDDHRYWIYGEFGTRNTGFRDVNVSPGETYTYRVIPWVVNDVNATAYTRETSKLGDSVPITTTLPDPPPFVAGAPTGITYNVYGHSTRLHVRWNEYLSIDEWRRIPAYIFQWRKASEEYETGLESEPRTVINAPTTYEQLQYEGFIATITQPPSWRLSIPGLRLNTSYYFRVGTCQELLVTAADVESCDLADVRFASERSFILSRNQQGASVRALAVPADDAGGAPEIRGSARVGETLTADTSAISDDDGMENAVFTHQWMAGETDIKNATGSSYTLTENERGKAVRVRVSFTDDAGNPEARTSLATAGVEPRSDVPASGAPVIMGTAQVGETLTADTSGISDDDGLNQVAYSYQWLADDAAIADATGSTYTLVEADGGKPIKVRVSFTDDAGHEESLTSKPTDAVASRPNSPATGAPTIGGTAQVGETLTADTSGIEDENGLDSVSYSYQWIAGGANIEEASGSTHILVDADDGAAIKVRVSFTDDAGNHESLTSSATEPVSFAVQQQTANNPATGAPEISGKPRVGETLTASTSGIEDEDGLNNVVYSYQWLAGDADIAEATATAYTLVDADEGAAIKVRVSFTDDAGNEETLTSVATDVVEARPNSPATGAPEISGTAQVGETLTADTSGITDQDGLSKVAYSYQWLADDAEIADATGSTYTLSDNEEGKAVQVKISFTDDAGHAETLTSKATDAVAAAAEPAEPPAPPTGLASQVSHDAVSLSWDDPGGDTITGYVILRRDRAIHEPGTFVTVTADTGSADTGYTDATVEPEKQYNYKIQAINEHGEVSERSDWVRANTPAAPPTDSPATGEPTITGTAQVGETLTVDTSGIADEDDLTTSTYSYQWVASDGTTDTDIPDATDASYTLVAGDEGRTIKVRVTVTDDLGNGTTLTSAATEAVAAAPQPDSPATGEPTITGTAQVGQTLTVDTSGIADDDGLDSAVFAYQWLSGDAEIGGATGLTYTLVDDDEGRTIKVRVTVTDDLGNGTTLTSAATEAVEAAPPTDSPATGQPTITGTVRVGEELTVDTSGIADDEGMENAVFTYRSMAGGTDIPNATGASYTLTEDDEGLTIQVWVSFTDDGGNPEALTSAATGTVEARLNSPATGQPTISGTVQVGETLTADTSGIADEDGLTSAVYQYQWLADGADIAGANATIYTLADADAGAAVKVRVSFTDDAGNEESLTSSATNPVVVPLTASLHDAPENHDGRSPFTFELRFSEELKLSYKKLRDHAFTVTGGTIQKAQRIVKSSNIRWRITVMPDSDSPVHVFLPATTRCGAQGGICASGGRKLSNSLELIVNGPSE